MDWNPLLMWISGGSAAVTLIRLIKAPSRQWGWVVVCLFVLAVLGAMYLINPDVAGYTGGVLWGMLILLPSILYRRTINYSTAMQYDRAANVFAIARWLHPFDGWWQSPRLYRAVACADRGEDGAAAAMLKPLEHGHSTMALTARLHARRLARDWQGVLAEISTLKKKSDLLRSSLILPTYLRALGELGRVDEMIARYADYRTELHSDAYSTARDAARLAVFVFSGRVMATTSLLAHRFQKLPLARHRFWQARAAWAAGQIDRAREVMQELAVVDASGRGAGGEQGALTYATQNGSDLSTALAANEVLAQSPAPAVFTPASEIMLLHIEEDMHHDEQFALTHSTRSKPLVTYVLVAMNVAMFLLEIAMGGSENEPTLLKLGAANASAESIGQWWRAITANFLHFGLAHLLMNMLALRSLGPFVERFVGRVRYVVIYMLSGIGAVGGVMTAQRHGWIEPGFLVGASGAIMGLIGATGAILLHGWLLHRSGTAKRRLRLIVLVVVLQVVFDNMNAQVSGTAHLLGMFFGFAFTWLLIPRRKVAHATSRA